MTIDLGYVDPPAQPPRRRRKVQLWIAGGGAAVAIAGAVFVASMASAHTTQSPAAPSASAAPSGPPGPGPGHGPFRGGPRGGFGPRFGFGPGFGPALHGEYTTTKPGGGYQTVDIQQGQVTAVSSTSITLKSADGFTKSYAVSASTLVDAQRDGISAVKVGDEVSVQATVSGSSATATDIADRTQIQQAHPKPSPTK